MRNRIERMIKMKEGQERFYHYILDRVKPEEKENAKKLLEEGFSNQDHGTFTPSYLTDFIPKMMDLIQPEHCDEVKSMMSLFRP